MTGRGSGSVFKSFPDFQKFWDMGFWGRERDMGFWGERTSLCVCDISLNFKLESRGREGERENGY